MNEKALKILEYNKIIEQLTDCAGSSLGKEKCRKLVPSSDLEEILTLQAETADALARLYRKGTLSFSGIHDIRASIMRLEVNSVLGAGELLHISSVLVATLRVKNYGKTINPNAKEEEEEGDVLSERFNLLEPLTVIANEIQRCILSEEEIADDASPGLKSVRRQIKLTNDKIRDQLNSLINSQENKLILQDNLITMRDGRYCLPVKSEHKNHFPGMVHDQSSSGSTTFIEPMAVVKLNNELRELAIKEQDEIEKILRSLSESLVPDTEALKYNITTLAELDFIFARAQLAKNMKASMPKFNDRGYLTIKKGRHPLIDARKVVPIDIYLGDEFSLLVITGPNTGGKTVTLKTVGLFTLMGQAGLHIPAAENSQLSVFHEVYADIGDEQSIEQSLSTFSSHMTNTVSILDKADSRSLCLFDELGAGTDPTEGAALAQAILTFLHNKGAHCIATTHYSELKVFALQTPGVCNACCEFSVETLSPTYRLLIGIPGKSNAFAISKKLGLSDEIISMADSFIGTKDKSFEDMISGLEDARVQMEKDCEEAARLLAEAEAEKKRADAREEKMDAQRERILREANEQAAKILAEAKEFADSTIRKVTKLGQSASGRDLERERSAIRDRLSETEGKLAIKPQKTNAKKAHSVEDIKVGDAVRVLSLGLDGKVITAPNQKGDMSVQMGALRSMINIRDVELIEEAKEPETEKAKNNKTGASKIAMGKSMHVSIECNVIGMRVDEALPIVDKYLDDAYLAHLEKVTIIHGRGTGALRDAIGQHLKRLKYVKSYRVGGFGEGDHGVTIVEFKES